MDADRNVIPIVEDDQGEGMKDPLTIDDIIEFENPFFQERKKHLFKKLIGNEFNENQPKVRWAPSKNFNRHR